MADQGRIMPALYAIVHNAVSPEGDDIRRWSDDQWRAWLSQIGYIRTYNKQSSGHYYRGQMTWAAVPWMLVPNGDGKDIYSDTWRVVPCFDDPAGYTGWHAGNWDINCRSEGYETYGRYDNKEMAVNGVWALANHIRTNIEARNGGKTLIKGHKEVSLTGTGCPNRMMEKIPLLVDMINTPAKYEEQYDPIPEWVKNLTDVEDRIYVAIENVDLVDLSKSYKVVKSFVKGDQFTIDGTTVVSGKTYGLTPYSFDNKTYTGFDMNKLKLVEIIVPEYVEKAVNIDPRNYVLINEAPLVDLKTGIERMKLNAGEEFLITKTTIKDGIEYGVDSHSVENGLWTAIPLSYLITKEEMNQYETQIEQLTATNTSLQEQLAAREDPAPYKDKITILEADLEASKSREKDLLIQLEAAKNIVPNTVEGRFMAFWEKFSPRIRFYLPYVMALFGGLAAIQYDQDPLLVFGAIVTFLFTWIQGFKAVGKVADDQKVQVLEGTIERV